jgi:hypothetical protein
MSLLKQVKGSSTAQLFLTHAISVGGVILLTYFVELRSEHFERLPWEVCTLLLFLLSAQLPNAVQTSRRFDALLALLRQKGIIEDEAVDSRQDQNAGRSTGTGARS